MGIGASQGHPDKPYDMGNFLPPPGTGYGQGPSLEKLPDLGPTGFQMLESIDQISPTANTTTSGISNNLPVAPKSLGEPALEPPDQALLKGYYEKAIGDLVQVREYLRKSVSASEGGGGDDNKVGPKNLYMQINAIVDFLFALGEIAKLQSKMRLADAQLEQKYMAAITQMAVEIAQLTKSIGQQEKAQYMAQAYAEQVEAGMAIGKVVFSGLMLGLKISKERSQMKDGMTDSEKLEVKKNINIEMSQVENTFGSLTDAAGKTLKAKFLIDQAGYAEIKSLYESAKGIMQQCLQTLTETTRKIDEDQGSKTRIIEKLMQMAEALQQATSRR